ncbi:hypothetical protein GOP47_0024971 [Adiantum capillus-veneris]|uniref:DNA repair metallo-beta-lactamase domain-containing protein n=1 Tax=Adiantum capillus-veneris TaxID=13818 RepID=A0A9D4Z5J2_ADICA|nr:hypothetical protein GOP47_0024971 [Adiantum capillus-veneris]
MLPKGRQWEKSSSIERDRQKRWQSNSRRKTRKQLPSIRFVWTHRRRQSPAGDAISFSPTPTLTTRGISPSFAPIFCTPLTARLVLLRYPQMHRSAFSFINIEEPKLIPDANDGSFTVTAYNASHCPGAVMFLFEGAFGTVLHTGDCRLTAECCARLPRRLFGGLVDCLFLDCTFGREAVRMPSREEAINQVKQCIWNHPSAPIVYLACDLLGQELLLRSLSCAFGFKIYVDKRTLADFYGSLGEVASDLITDDSKTTRLHVCEGFPKLYEKAKTKFAAAYAKNEPEPLFIRPSAQWYTYGERLEGVGSGLLLLEKIYEKAPAITRRRIKSAPTKAERDPFGIWHVCYSMHSSQDELELFASNLKPRQVISTTPHCKATELSYVRSLRYTAAHARQISKIISMPVQTVEEREKASDDKKEDAPDAPLKQVSSPIRHLPLFGMAVAGLMPSPPLAFDSSEDCPSGSIEEVDSVAGSPWISSKHSPFRTSLSLPLSSPRSPYVVESAALIGKASSSNEKVDQNVKEISQVLGSPKGWKLESKEGHTQSPSSMMDCSVKPQDGSTGH